MGITRRLRRGAAALCAVALLTLAGAVLRAGAEEAWVVESEGYTLREAPKPGAKSVGSVKVGERVFVLGRAAGWIQVETGERRGWVTESGIGAEAPASLRLGPLQERVSGLEASVGRLEGERASLQEENRRLGERVAELEDALSRSRREAAEARTSGRLGVMALGGGLVILGWIAGYALAALRRRGGTRYTIG